MIYERYIKGETCEMYKNKFLFYCFCSKTYFTRNFIYGTRVIFHHEHFYGKKVTLYHDYFHEKMTCCYKLVYDEKWYITTNFILW